MELSFPVNVPVCLSKLSQWTGWGESTLREAAILGQMKAQKKGGKWCATLSAYSEWATSEGGRDVGDSAKRQSEADRPIQEPEGERSGCGIEDLSPSIAQAKAGRPRKSKRATKREVVWDEGQRVA